MLLTYPFYSNSQLEYYQPTLTCEPLRFALTSTGIVRGFDPEDTVTQLGTLYVSQPQYNYCMWSSTTLPSLGDVSDITLANSSIVQVRQGTVTRLDPDGSSHPSYIVPGVSILTARPQTFNVLDSRRSGGLTILELAPEFPCPLLVDYPLSTLQFNTNAILPQVSRQDGIVTFTTPSTQFYLGYESFYTTVSATATSDPPWVVIGLLSGTSGLVLILLLCLLPGRWR
jgi:hypothetical protein